MLRPGSDCAFVGRGQRPAVAVAEPERSGRMGREVGVSGGCVGGWVSGS